MKATIVKSTQFKVQTSYFQVLAVLQVVETPVVNFVVQWWFVCPLADLSCHWFLFNSPLTSVGVWVKGVIQKEVQHTTPAVPSPCPFV